MAGPNPATTEWVPVWSPQIAGPSGGGAGGAHGPTHLPAGSDPIPNVALNNINNNFNTRQTITGSAAQHAELELRDGGGVHPGIVLTQPAASIDLRKWRILNYQDGIRFDAVNDAENALTGGNQPVRIERTGTINAPAGLSATTPVPDPCLSANIPRKNVDNLWPVSQTFPDQTKVVGPNAQFWMRDTSAPAGSTLWRLLGYSNGNLYLESLNDPNAGIASQFAWTRAGVFSGPAVSAGTLTASGAGGISCPSGPVSCSHVEAANHIRAVAGLYAGTDFYEKGRGTPAGHWIGVAHAPGNFYALGPMVWTVSAASMYGNTYMRVGNTATWTVYLVECPLSGTPSAALYIQLPPGLGAGVQSDGTYCEVYSPGAGWVPGSVNVEVGNSRVIIAMYNKGNFGVGGGCHIRFTLTFRTA